MPFGESSCSPSSSFLRLTSAVLQIVTVYIILALMEPIPIAAAAAAATAASEDTKKAQ
jgi:hypothetical protein